MPLEAGDEVLLALSRDEFISGEVVSTDFPDVFSDGWTIEAVITEGGHPLYGQAGIYHSGDIVLFDTEGSA